MARIMYAKLGIPDPETSPDWRTVEKKEIGIADVASISADLNRHAQRATLGDGSVVYLEIGQVGHAMPSPKVVAIHHIWVTSLPEAQ